MNTLQYDLPKTASSKDEWKTYRPSIKEQAVANENPPLDSSTLFLIIDETKATSWFAAFVESTGHKVRKFNSAEAFLDSYNGLDIGCLICDVRLPGMSGLELLRRLAERAWDIPVVMRSEDTDVQTAVLALKNGAIDFIDTTCHEPMMLDLIHSAVSLHVQRSRRRAEWANLKAQIGQLTPREFEVMQLVVAGLPNKTIAVDLGVSSKTVEAHRAHVMKKMAVRSLPDLVRLAIRSHELQNGYTHKNHNGVPTPLR